MTDFVAAFGEVMLRLTPPDSERILQSPHFLASFGGGEANVVVSLANFGLASRFITVLPAANPVADAFISELRRFGVDNTHIVRGPGRMGVYFLETGANQGTIDWDRAFENITWFHITGITPAISASTAELAIEALKKAQEKGIRSSCDLNYRKNLWKWGKAACEVMPE